MEIMTISGKFVGEIKMSKKYGIYYMNVSVPYYSEGVWKSRLYTVFFNEWTKKKLEDIEKHTKVSVVGKLTGAEVKDGELYILLRVTDVDYERGQNKMEFKSRLEEELESKFPSSPGNIDEVPF